MRNHRFILVGCGRGHSKSWGFILGKINWNFFVCHPMKFLEILNSNLDFDALEVEGSRMAHLRRKTNVWEELASQ